MTILLTDKERSYLADGGVIIDSQREYSEDEALQILDRVRDLEVQYAQTETYEGQFLYRAYCDIGDKIFYMIPE